MRKLGLYLLIVASLALCAFILFVMVRLPMM